MIFKIKELIEEIKDGVTVTVELEEDFYFKLGDILKNGKGELPLKINVNIKEPDDE
jgi:hypothetical protein